MKNRKFLSLFTILILSGVFFGYNQLTPSSQVPPSIVVGLPHDYNPFEVIAPYSGPHPSKITRPAETFNFPIKLGETGPVKPLFAGPLEYPFLCRTFESGLGQPLVDNQRGEGIEVFKLTPDGQRTSEVIGYSKDCSAPSRAFYMYARENDEYFYPLQEANHDIEKITINGRSIEFIVRVETGTINRQPYIIYALKGADGTLEKPVPGNWNKRLIYQFKGGVGIGKRQGKLNIKKLLNRRKLQLKEGYAIVHSTANQTSNHYNIWLAEDAALRVKQQFTALYGKADYTFGFGGSGGAIQQYRKQGHADNPIIWMTQKPHTPMPEALLLLEQWLNNISRAPEKSLAENRPANAIDKCFNAESTLIAEGSSVWNGEWNNKEIGKCMSLYPSYQTSQNHLT